MVRIGDFVPDIINKDTKLTEGNQWLNKIYDKGFSGFMKSQYGSETNSQSAAQYYGIEQLYFDWLRQAYAYRRMFIQDLYLLAFDSSEIRSPLLHLKKEIFRKGFDDFHPKFLWRCDECDMDFQSIEDAKKHKKKKGCKDHKLRKPDDSQIKDFDKKWRYNCNIFGQDLESVLNSIEDDLNIVDDAYIHLNKQYRKVGNKLHGQLLEVRRIHPALIEFDLDKAGLPKNSHWICPFHRDDVRAEDGTCETCHAKLLPAMYVYNHRGGRVYMLEDELIHVSKFSPHETYGYSPILTLMQKVLTVSGMDRFLYRYFFERKTPTQMILTNTDDPQSLEVERARMESKMLEDPTYTPWIAVSNRTGRGKTDVVKLFHTLQEMDYLNVRNEIRDRIAGIYGVPQMFYNVMEGTGGISGQSVSGDTPIWIRRDKKFLDLIPIESLHKGTANEYNLIPQNTEVYSQDGWTKINHVWRHVTKENETLAIETNGGFVETTMDHSVMKNKMAIKSSDLKENDLIDIKQIDIENNFDSITPDLAWFLGFYAAEGHLERCRFSVCNTNIELINKASNILESTFNKEIYKYEREPRERNKTLAYVTSICGKLEAEYIKSLCYESYNIKDLNKTKNKKIKKVPIQILNGSKKIKEAYLEGYIDGDGTKFDNGFRCTSTSLVLTAGIEYLAKCLDYSMNVEFRNDNNLNRNWSNNWRLTSRKKEKEIGRIKRIRRIKAPRFVYDIETESHTFVGGIGNIVLHNTQQLKMMSNVVASDQRLFNEKIIPAILKAIGITDWEIFLRTPEEKIEGEVLQLAQQKVAIATSMRQLGFDIKLKPGVWDIDTLDFSFGGKALSLEEQQQQQMEMMSGGMGGSMAEGQGGAVPVDENGMPMQEGQEGAGGIPVDTPTEDGKRPLALEEGAEIDREAVPKKHRLEEVEYDVPTPEEEDEEEEDNNENKVWN